MERSKLSVYSSSISHRTPGALQACKIAFLYHTTHERVVAIAEGSSVFLLHLPLLQATLSPEKGKPYRLQTGFQEVESILLFSFSSGVSVESLIGMEIIYSWSRMDL